MSDATDDDALVAALNANDVEATWCGPHGIMQQAAARITELRARVAELEAREAWLPIETAPRDEWFMVWKPNQFPSVEFSYGVRFGATHWRPLPAPPESPKSAP